MKCIKDIMASFSKLFNRKEQENENERLRLMYTKPRWAATTAQLVEWILAKFDKALNGDFNDEMWPRENPFSLGLMRIRNKYAREQRTWNEQQKKLGDGDDDDMEEEDVSSSSEEEED